MRGMLTALALLIAASGAAEAACKDEVAAALDRQRKSSGFRMQTVMLSQDGLVNMTVDYVLPDRMHQTVSTLERPQAGRDDPHRQPGLEPSRRTLDAASTRDDETARRSDEGYGRRE